MNPKTFYYSQGEGYCESFRLSQLAKEHGTPLYVYSKLALSDRCHRWKAAFSSYPTLSCFAVKANFSPSILKTIFSFGFGADVVSVGELNCALEAGAKAEQIVFSGVGKQEHEIRRALEVGILSFHVESEEEIADIRAIAESMNKPAPISFRVNPHIDAKTHPHIATGLYETKFGVPEADVRRIAQTLVGDPFIRLVGVSCHLGSQITELGPFQEAATRLTTLAADLQAMGHKLQILDLGGGLGIRYRDESPPAFEDLAKTILPLVRKTNLKLVLEPGRCLVAEAGILLTKVVRTKRSPVRKFVIVDAGMNDLIRPSLYGAYHEIETVREPSGQNEVVDIVGPVCETADCFGESRSIAPTAAGDLLMIRNAGAYGSSMASHYNVRPKAKEILVDGSRLV